VQEAQVGGASRWRWLALLLLVGLLAGFARRDALEVGLLGDDYMHHAMLVGSYPGEGYVPWDLYAFLRDDASVQEQHIERGTAPWWSVVNGDPDADDGTIVFAVLRPLSSALLWVDHELWPLERDGAVRARHLHSLVWFVATIVAAGLVFGHLFERRVAIVALVLFACDAGLMLPLAWLANRCVLVSASFGLLGIWAHLRWRSDAAQERRNQFIALECACMGLAVAAGEYGLLAAAYVLAWELVGTTSGSVAQRLRATAPALVPAGIYLLLHESLGYGTFGPAYLDLHHVGGWLSLAASRAAKLATSAIWAVPPTTGVGFGIVDDSGHLLVCAILLPLAGALVALVRVGLTVPERRALRAMVLGAALGLVPITAAPPQERLLVLTQLGACALIALIAVASARLLWGSIATPRSWPRRLLAVPFVLALLAANVGFDLRSGESMLETIGTNDASTLAAFSQGTLPLIGPEALRGRDVVVLNAVDLPTALHGGFVLEAQGWPAVRSWRTLAMGPFAMSATRLAPDTLELWAVQGAWLETTYEQNFRRADQPLHAGDVRDRGGLRVEVVEDLRGHPTRIRVRFAASLDDPRYLFLISTKQGLRRWQPPALGKPRIVPLPSLPSARRRDG
jgi:hypothetical protein